MTEQTNQPPTAATPTDGQVTATLQLFQSRLKAVHRGPQDFSTRGSAALVEAQNEHLRSIGLEAIRLAVDDRSDYVDESHVERARGTLFTRKARSDWLKWLGGLLLGVAIPLIVQFGGEKAPPRSLFYWLIGTFAFGLATTMLAVGMELADRRRAR